MSIGGDYHGVTVVAWCHVTSRRCRVDVDIDIVGCSSVTVSSRVDIDIVVVTIQCRMSIAGGIGIQKGRNGRSRRQQ